MDISVEWDSRKALNFIDKVHRKATKIAMARTINDTGKSLKAESNRQIRKRIALKAKSVRESLYTRGKASPSQELDQMTIAVGAKALGVPLYDYGAKQTKSGVSVKVLKQGSRKVIKGAFIAQMKSGHTGVFVRNRMAVKRGWKVKGGVRPRSKFGKVGANQKFVWWELPISELKAKNVASAMQDVIPTITPQAQVIFGKRFKYWFDREMAKVSVK